VFYHDNALSHTSLTVREVSAKHDVTTFPTVQMAADFFLFPRTIRSLKEHGFGTVEAVQAASTESKTAVFDFQKAYEEDWKKRCRRCVFDAGGLYFEEH